MKRAIFYSPINKPSGEALAFAAGLERHGWRVAYRRPSSGAPCDLAIMWSVRRRNMINYHRQNGGDICILERGYIGDRSKWTSVSFGGELNNRAEFRGVNDDSSRFSRNFGAMLQPWRSSRDGYALLIGQMRNDMSLAAVNGSLDEWYRQATQGLRARGYEVRFRPHPGMTRRGIAETVEGAPTRGGSLEEALAGAAVVVTFNSNTSVEAVLAGVPVIACDHGCMAWPVVGQGLRSDVVMPAREDWAARLAWCQWSAEEMASGECWAHVGAERAAV